MQWLEITIKVKDGGSDIMAEVLREKGADIVSIESVQNKNEGGSDSKWPVAEEQYIYDPNEYMYARAYYEYDEKTNDEIFDFIKSRVDEILSMDLGIDFGECSVYSNMTDDKDWANDWKKFFKPIHITKDVIVKPSWEEYEAQKGDIVLEIDPGLAFGTGMHETTQMCMEFIEKYVNKGATVADVGCGTGILAILAAKIGAKDIKAIDLDPVCIPVARQNTEVNNVGDVIEVIEGDLLDKLKDKVDILIANIVADPIISIIKDLDRVLKPGGYFIASGIIDTREQDVLNALKNKELVLIEKKTEKVWVALVARM